MQYVMPRVLVEAQKGNTKLSPGPETVMGHQRAPYQLLLYFICDLSPKLQNSNITLA
jgi:hypothetical protein